MMKMDFNNKTLRMVVLFVPLLLGTYGCSNDVTASYDDSDDGDLIIVTAGIDDEDAATRGPQLTTKTLTEFSVFSITSNKIKNYNIHYTKDTGGNWKGDGALTWSNKSTVDFLAIIPGLEGDYVHDITVNKTERSFNYTIPTDVALQKDLMYSSQYGKTKSNTGGVVKFSFKHALSFMRIYVKQCIEWGNIEIGEFKLHNVIDGGKLSFNMTTQQKVSDWELTDTRCDITQTYTPAKTLIRNKNVEFVQDNDIFMLMPQVTKNWSMDADAVAQGIDKRIHTQDAIAAGESFVELKVRIYSISDGGKYLAGCADDDPDETKPRFISIYFPFADATWKMAATNKFYLNFDGGYNEDGTRFDISQMEVTLESNQPTTFIIEGWTDDEVNSGDIKF